MTHTSYPQFRALTKAQEIAIRATYQAQADDRHGIKARKVRELCELIADRQAVATNA